MAMQSPDPNRLIELLIEAADTWVAPAEATGWTDLLGHWRGTADLMDFALRFPTRTSQQAAGELPRCVVFVEFARWSLTANAPDTALAILRKQSAHVLSVVRPLKWTKLIQAIIHTVLAAISAKDIAACCDHLQHAADLYDQEWNLTGLRTGRSPDNPIEPAFAAEDKSIRNRGHRLLDLAAQCGAFRTDGVSISTWLVLYHLLNRIFGQDTQHNISDNEARVLLYAPDDRRGQVARMTFEMVKAPVPGIYPDPLAFGITRVRKSMRDSLRVGFRCCRQQAISEGAAIRVGGELPLTVASLAGSSAGGLFAAAMIVTARQQPLDLNRSATCRLSISTARLTESEDVPLDPQDVQLGSIGSVVRKIDEAWQQTHGIEEVFLSESDETLWRTANPGRMLPRVTGIQTLHQLIDGLTTNQNFDRELDRHARWVHGAWDRVRQAIRNDTPEDDRDHRFDCYIEPTFRIEGPVSRQDTSTEDRQGEATTEQMAGRPVVREREEFKELGDPTLDRDEQLLNLLAFSFRGTPFPIQDDHPPAPGWLKPRRPIVIYDNAGAGKTVCSHRLRHLLTDPQHRERLLGQKSPPLVIRLDGRWRREFGHEGRPLTIRQLLVVTFAEESDRTRIEQQSLMEDTVAYALRESRVVLILDGFDQFPDEDRDYVVKAVTQQEDSKHCHWIITSRVHTIDDLRAARKCFEDDRWTRVRIDPFTPVQQDQYFQRLDANDRCIGERWLATIGGEGNRTAMKELLELPMVLWMIRVLVDEADRGQEPLPVFFSLSQLYLVTSRKLLARALELNREEVEQRLKKRGIAIPNLSVEQQLTELEHVLTLMAFQLMLMEEYNGQVGSDRIRPFEELCRNRYVRELRRRFEAADEFDRDEIREEHGQQRSRWTWAVEVLKTIELNHRSVTEAYNDAGLAFRSRKMLECHAARYLTCYATEWDIFADRNPKDMPVVNPRQEKQNLSTLCAWNYTTHPQWKDTWELAIEMPQKPVSSSDRDGVIARAVMDHEVTCRSLSALFERPKAWAARDIRPTELIYRAWHLFELDLPLLRERRFLIAGRIVAGRELDELQLRSQGEQLLLGVLPQKHAVVSERQAVLTRFRLTNKDSDTELTKQIMTRLDTVLDAKGNRVKLPADAKKRKQLLSQWQQQSSTEKSLTFLQCPPQSLLDAFHSLPKHQQTTDRNPCINPAIKGRETEPIHSRLIQATTVTRGMYAVFDPAFERSQLKPDYGNGDLQQTLNRRASAFGEYTEDAVFPILCPNWFDAWVFCKWMGAGYRLPTEFEWEHACRAGTTSLYHFGDGLNGHQANCDGNRPHGKDDTGKDLGKGPYLERTTPVGCVKYPCNDYGLFDVHGNAWEWCQDRRNADDDSPGSSRVLRGGSWDGSADDCRSANRYSGTPGDRSDDAGFRLVCE